MVSLLSFLFISRLDSNKDAKMLWLYVNQILTIFVKYLTIYVVVYHFCTAIPGLYFSFVSEYPFIIQICKKFGIMKMNIKTNLQITLSIFLNMWLNIDYFHLKFNCYFLFLFIFCGFLQYY